MPAQRDSIYISIFFSLPGKYPVLGFENEKRLVAHILKLGDAGFPPERNTIRQLAYQFAENLGLKHNFNNETKTAGPQWLKSFLERNPEVVLRQAEGLSIERARGLNRAEVAKFFNILITVLTENDLLDKPDRIFNMDETGVQLNNKPGKVLAKKGTRAVKSVTSGEKGETITIVACCNAIGNFLPPLLIIKGVNKKPEFEEGLPPGSKVYMNKKSAYISSDLFYRWLTEHFIPRKPPGKVLLILDGHSSHSSAVNMLEAARDNDVILLCLPSHTTSALQPLDRSVFGPFKKYYFAETNHFMRTNPQKKLNRYNAGQLIAKAWIRATTPANAISGFRGSGIYPVNPNALSDAEFAISDIALEEHAQEREFDPLNDEAPGVFQEPTLCESVQESEPDLNQRNETPPLGDQVPNYAEAEQNSVNQNHTPPRTSLSVLNLSHDCLDLADGFIEKYIMDGTELSFPSLLSLNEPQNQDLEKETPSKFLHQSSPIPKIPLNISKRAKQSAEILNSNDKIDQKKNKEDKINNTNKITETKNNDSKTGKNKPAGSKKTIEKKRGQLQKKKQTKRCIDITSSETESDNTDYIKLTERRALRKRRIQIYSSDSENEENIYINPKSLKGKATKGLPTKSRSRDTEKKIKVENANLKIKNINKKNSDNDYCVECFENYNFTKSKSDWIQCQICRMWLHETCTTFENNCMRCGKMKTLTCDD